MVTYIPVVFGRKASGLLAWPTGYLLSRLGRPLMILGLLLIAIVDVGSISTSGYRAFLTLRQRRRCRLGDVGHGGDHGRGQRAATQTPASRGECALDE